MVVDVFSKMLVTNVQINYQQNVNQIFNVADDKSYFVVGRTQGNGTVGHVIGPTSTTTEAIANLGNICNASSVAFTWLNPGGEKCEAGGQIRYLLDVVATSVGFTIQAQDMIINENIGLQFGTLVAVGA